MKFILICLVSLNLFASSIIFNVGGTALNLKRDNVKVKIIAIDNGNYVLKFLEGPLKGKIGADWTPNDLASLNGCTSDNNCVGDMVYNIKRKSAKVKIVAIDSRDELVLKFLSGDLKRKNFNSKIISYYRAG